MLVVADVAFGSVCLFSSFFDIPRKGLLGLSPKAADKLALFMVISKYVLLVGVCCFCVCFFVSCCLFVVCLLLFGFLVVCCSWMFVCYLACV